MKVPDIVINNLERQLDKLDKKRGTDVIDCIVDIINAAKIVVDEAVKEDA